MAGLEPPDRVPGPFERTEGAAFRPAAGVVTAGCDVEDLPWRGPRVRRCRCRRQG
ncbi:unnamed protein product [[Actinomadura] parvosata subsp. kistnae]|nr:unnamed protein product [Actinomadura parvosata subsp. kistnae]